MNLSVIRDSILSRATSLDDMVLLLTAVGLAVLIIAGVFIVARIRAKRNRYNAHGTISDPEQIHEYIQKAFDQRRAFEVQIYSEADTRRPNLRCSPEYLGPNALTLAINGIETLSDRWLKREVSVYFQFYLEGALVFYTFVSRIDGIYSPMQGLCHITMPIPERLENRQKRAFLRLTPPLELYKGAAMWHGRNMPGDTDLADITHWAPPSLIQLPGKIQQFQVLNLSAGGMRIHIPYSIVREKYLEFSAVERILMMIDLLEPENNKLLRLWMHCRIQSVWFEHPSRDLYMGMQYMSWARPREGHTYPGTYSLEWLRLSRRHEIEPIGNWIMRRHLELFREAPHTDGLL